ncbi:MAG TPA: hypothetical protein VMW73_17990, partial [Spirochaetia bacterium]|nr:hypothetical protein [Spirochaetia bacterium]
MNSSIEVQIDENRYVPLLRLERGAAGSVVLTSREPRQERAVLRLFATRSRTERTHLWTTEIDNIPLEPARPRIDLRVSYRRTVLQVEISLNGLPRQTAKVRIPGERRNPVPVIAAVTAFAVVAAGAAVILTQPSAATAQPSAATAQPSAATAQPSAATAQPSAATAQPSAATAQPSAATA